MCNTHPRYGKQLMRSSTGSEKVFQIGTENTASVGKGNKNVGTEPVPGAGFYPLRSEKGL